MNNIIITHNKCSDGLAAAHILQSICTVGDKDVYFLNHSHDNVELESMGFWQRLSDINNRTDDFFHVYITDYCLDVKTLERLLETADKALVVILDHHKSAQEDLTSEAYITLLNAYKHRVESYFDMRFSGATLSWLYVYEPGLLQEIVRNGDKSTPSYKMDVYKRIPTWLRHVMSRDIWQWVEEDAKPFSDVFKNYCTKLSDMRAYFPLNNELICCESVKMMVKEGRQYRKMLEGQLELMLKDGGKKTITLPESGMTVNVFAINLPAIFSSDTAQFVFSTHPDVNIFLGYRILPNGLYDFSLRSRDGVDCSRIAKEFGGGGHPQASGFKRTIDNINPYLTDIFAYKE